MKISIFMILLALTAQSCSIKGGVPEGSTGVTLNTSPGLGSVKIGGIAYYLPHTFQEYELTGRALTFYKDGFKSVELRYPFPSAQVGITQYPSVSGTPRGLIISLVKLEGDG